MHAAAPHRVPLSAELLLSCGRQLFDAANMPQKTHKIVHVVPRLDFSCLHGGAAPRRGEMRQTIVAQDQQAVAQVAAPAEASPEGLKLQPHATKPVEAAIACLGPLAMLPPKQPAMRREFTFVV